MQGKCSCADVRKGLLSAQCQMSSIRQRLSPGSQEALIDQGWLVFLGCSLLSQLVTEMDGMKFKGVCCRAAMALSFAVASTSVWSALGTHEHGVAELSVAIEGERVDVMLTAPTGDLVGLERAPANEQERASVLERVAALESGNWFAFSGGRCQQVAVEVTLPVLLTAAAPVEADESGASATGKDGHGHHRHDHGSRGDGTGQAEHAHGQHARHGQHHGHHHGQHHGMDDADVQHHLDGVVHWQYRCETGVRLRHVDVQLFDLLPLQRIRAQTISERGQGARTLTPRVRRVNLP